MTNKNVDNKSTGLDKTDYLQERKLKELTVYLKSLEICKELGSYYSKTNLVPNAYKNMPFDCAVAIQWGLEIGLNPIQSLQNIAVINGTPSIYGDAMLSLVRSSFRCEFFKIEYDKENQIATAITKRLGEDVIHTRSFSMNDAIIAGLADRDAYKKYPERMLSHRARSHILRDVFPDILNGLQMSEIVIDDDINDQCSANNILNNENNENSENSENSENKNTNVVNQLLSK